MRRATFSCFLVVLVGIPSFVFGATYQIDPGHSSFQFKIRHMTVSNVAGQFKKVKGVVKIDDGDLTNLAVDVDIEATSVDTDHAKRDEHLRGEDFFFVSKYPAITFVSKKVTQAGENRLKVVGDLTIRGVTREIVVDVEGPTQEVKDPGGNFRRGATGTSKINRKDFGILWHRVLDNGGLVVGDEVHISLEIELIRK